MIINITNIERKAIINGHLCSKIVPLAASKRSPPTFMIINTPVEPTTPYVPNKIPLELGFANLLTMIKHY